DALRMYILSDSPYDRDVEWNEGGLVKKYNFLSRVHAHYVDQKDNLPKGIAELDKTDVVDAWSKSLLLNFKTTLDDVESAISKHHNFNSVIAKTHGLANAIFVRKDE